MPVQDLVVQLFIWFSYVQFARWLSAELTQKWKQRGRGGNGRLLSSTFKCFSHSKCSSSLSAQAQPHEGTSSAVLMMTVCIIGYADHRRKPFCLALIPSGSFTFWRIEKNELKIKIVSLIWLHPRFMAVAFKGNWKNQLQNSHLYHFLSFNIL
jgi:hypothetical protein